MWRRPIRCGRRRELAWQLTDREGHFFSESSVDRILKAYDLIPSPAFIVLSASKSFRHPTQRPNELGQTDCTYLQVVGWGWYYLSTVLDDYARLQHREAAADVDASRRRDRDAGPGPEPRPGSPRSGWCIGRGPSATTGRVLCRESLQTISRPTRSPTPGGYRITRERRARSSRYHRSMKNVVKLEKYYSPWELERAVARFVDDYKPSAVARSVGERDTGRVYAGRRPAILARREQITRRTLAQRKRENLHIPPRAVNRHKVSAYETSSLVRIGLTTYSHTDTGRTGPLRPDAQEKGVQR